MTDEATSPPPSPESPAATPEKKSKVGCIIGGCVGAAFLGIVGFVVLAMIIYRANEASGEGPFTFGFDPSTISQAQIAADQKITDDEWPKMVGDYTYDGPAFTEGIEFDDNEIGGAVYVDAEKTVEIYVSIVPFDSVETYQRIVNNTYNETIGDGASQISLVGNSAIFSSPDMPTLKFVFLPFQGHAAHFTFERLDEGTWDSAEVEAVVDQFYGALGGE